MATKYTPVRLGEEWHERAAEVGMSPSELIRESLAYYWENHKSVSTQWTEIETRLMGLVAELTELQGARPLSHKEAAINRIACELYDTIQARRPEIPK